MMRIKRRLGVAGFSTLQAMIGATLVGFLAATYLTLDQVSKKMDARINAVGTIETLRSNIVEILNNRDAFQNSINFTRTAYSYNTALPPAYFTDRHPYVDSILGWRDQNFALFLNAGFRARLDAFKLHTELEWFFAVPPAPYNSINAWRYNMSIRPLILRRADNTLFYNSTLPDAGFTFDGRPCQNPNGFNAALGSDYCPIHFEISWNFECDTTGWPGTMPGQCRCPIILVAAKAMYNPASTHLKGQINAEKFGISPPMRVSLDPWCGGN